MKKSTRMNISEKMKKNIIDILSKRGAKKISIFGSFARNAGLKKSDVDILVEFNKRDISYFEFIALENSLSEKLNRRVDLLTEEAINPLILENIKRDEVVIYEAE